MIISAHCFLIWKMTSRNSLKYNWLDMLDNYRSNYSLLSIECTDDNCLLADYFLVLRAALTGSWIEWCSVWEKDFALCIDHVLKTACNLMAEFWQVSCCYYRLMNTSSAIVLNSSCLCFYVIGMCFIIMNVNIIMTTKPPYSVTFWILNLIRSLSFTLSATRAVFPHINASHDQQFPKVVSPRVYISPVWLGWVFESKEARWWLCHFV